MRNRFGVMLAMVLAGWVTLGSAQEWRYYPPLDSAGLGGIVVGDLDGDGIEEAVLSGYASSNHHVEQVLAVLGGEQDVPERLRSVMTDDALFVSLLAGRASDGTGFVVALGPWGGARVGVYSGVPMRRVRTLDIARNVLRLVAMVDLAGVPKLVVLVGGASSSEYLPAIIDFTSGSVDWIGTDPVHDVAVAPFGPAGEPKLILASTPGRILDATTRAVEWSWPAGFGREIATGRFGPNAQPGFAIRTDRWQGDTDARVDVFAGQPYARVRSFTNVGDVRRILTLQESGTDGDTVAFATGSLPAEAPVAAELALYRPSTGQLVRKLPLGCGTPVQMAAGKIDGTGKPRLIYATRRINAQSTLCVTDLTSGTTLYEAANEAGPYSAIVRGDLAGNGSDEVVTVGQTKGSTAPVIRVFDAENGKLLRSAVAESGFSNIPFVIGAQLDSDPQLEIILANPGPIVEARDGRTLQLQWLATFGEYRSVNGLASIDANGDGTPDVLVLTQESRLIVLDGRNGTELWRSIALPSAQSGGIATFKLNDTPHAAIGTDRGIYLFDLTNRVIRANRSMAGAVVALRQWHSDIGCRIGVGTTQWGNQAALSVHTCDTLAPVAEWALPFTPTALWPLGASGNHFLLADNVRLHELRPDGVFATWPEKFGSGLALGNQGDVRASVSRTLVDATLGSGVQVARVQLRLDEIFVDTFGGDR